MWQEGGDTSVGRGSRKPLAQSSSIAESGTWCALLPWSPLRRQHQASSSSPPRGMAPQSQGRPPAASSNHPAEAWVCLCNSLRAASADMYWVIPTPSPAHLLTFRVLTSPWCLGLPPVADRLRGHSSLECTWHLPAGSMHCWLRMAEAPPFTPALPDAIGQACLVRLSCQKRG